MPGRGQNASGLWLPVDSIFQMLVEHESPKLMTQVKLIKVPLEHSPGLVSALLALRQLPFPPLMRILQPFSYSTKQAQEALNLVLAH